jgi:hypothetical protein
MPKSKHRRKRAKAPSAQPPLPEGPDLPEIESDLELDPEFAAALARAEEELAAEIAAAEAGERGPYLASDDDDDEAISLIGAVLMFELNEVMQNGREFDPVRYAGRLAALPRLPDLD